jgi:hypothetical protein
MSLISQFKILKSDLIWFDMIFVLENYIQYLLATVSMQEWRALRVCSWALTAAWEPATPVKQKENNLYIYHWLMNNQN